MSTTPDDRATLGGRGWLLLGAVALALFILPATVLIVPEFHEQLTRIGVSQELFFALPLLPAITLAVVAVWVAVATGRDG